MKRVAAAALIALGIHWAVPAMAALRGPVRVETGLLSGVPGDDASVTAFKGIPYAAPPVGALRWRPPQSPPGWQGVRAADHFGPICPQPAANGPGGLGQVEGLAMSEDCLFLNVWTGARSGRERRPVMVWFHGAGPNQAGSLPLYWGENLAKKGVVVVSVDYRIGVLGGLAAPELSKESEHGTSGNYTLLDDIAALKWVQKNIAAFGGDPNKVTLFGQSYGAGTQHRLSLSPLAKGLFKRMILQSHARYPRDPVIMQVATSYQTLANAEENGARYMEKLGVHSLAELRALPWQKLVAAYPGESSQLVDGYVVPHDYTDTYSAGTQNNVLVIAGVNRDETGAAPETAFQHIAARAANAPASPPTNNVPPVVASLTGLKSYAGRMFGPMADEYLKLYPADSDEAALHAHNQSVRDNARISLWMWATAWRAKATQPVYLYFWDHAPPGPNHDITGAYHGSEIAYALDNASPPNESWTDEDRRIGDIMSSYWTNFAKRGNPNGPGLPQWPEFDGRKQQVMQLGEQFRPMPLAEPAKVDFWKRFYQTQPAR
jgi:para-nitrobenzyl esterase